MIAPKVVVAAVLVVGVTGCGGSGDTADSTVPVDETPAAVQSTTVTATSTSTAPPASTAPTTTAVTTTTTAPTTTAAATTTGAPTTTAAPPTVVDLAPGLFCRDVAAAGFGYADAVAYWVREGEPDRMDADRNGIPCETVYPESDVLAFWGDPLPTTTAGPGVAVRYFAPTEPWEYPEPWPPGSDTYGSGCSPGTTALPNGMWFGFLADYGPSEIAFDLACIYAPGPDEEGGARIQNDNPRIRTIAIDPTIPVHFVVGGWVNGVEPYERWITRGCYDPACPVWLYVNSDGVTAMAEHFLTG